MERDWQCITEAVKFARIQRLDFLLIIHYHHDHVGGVPLLVRAVPVGSFIDHGLLHQPGKPMDEDYGAYQEILAPAQIQAHRRPTRRQPAAMPIWSIMRCRAREAQLVLQVVGTAPCRSVPKNARSVGILLAFGKLRILDLGDLTWDNEIQLMCPNNKLGKIDLYTVSHHGFEQSGSPALVDAIFPRIAVMDNAQRRGVRRAPGRS